MVSNAKINRQWVLRQRPKGLVQPGDLELVETPVPEVKESEVLVRTVYLSLDPTNRTWMRIPKAICRLLGWERSCAA